MGHFFLVLALSCHALGSLHPAKSGPVEIDFSPLPGLGAKAEYRLRVKLIGAGGGGLEQEYTIGADTDPADVAELILGSLPDGFEAKRDGGKLTVASFDNKPVVTAQVVVSELPLGFFPPKMRRLPKK